MSEFESLDTLTDEQIRTRISALKSEINIIDSGIAEKKYFIMQTQELLKKQQSQIKKSIRLPYLVGNFVEHIEIPDERNPKKTINCSVVKTTDRHSIFLPNTGLIPKSELSPGELIGVNKDTYIIYEKLPNEYDTRVKSMYLDEKPDDDYCDIGGLDKQIQELKEAVVLPISHGELYVKIGIRAPKGVLLYGPPGTGKTLLARACAKETEAAFIKLSATQLSQMYIGEGARMVRDCFDLAKEKIEKDHFKGAIIFIDEIDAVGVKRGNEGGGSREVQRTLLELLNQLDGFSSDTRIK
ncbi:hypothetical protein WA158_005247 [Blastocystis sp. Blastoise]